MAQQPEGTLANDIFDRYVQPPRYELCDLQADPQELRNLANDPAYITSLKALQASLRTWMTQTQAPLGKSKEQKGN